MRTDQIFGVLTSVVVLAGISVAIVNGGKTAKVFGAAANGFARIIKAATLQSR